MVRVDHDRNVIELETLNDHRPLTIAVRPGRSFLVGRLLVVGPEDANQLSVALVAFGEAMQNDTGEG